MATTDTEGPYQPPSGYLGNLNAEQQSALDQLKKELKEQKETVFALEGEDGFAEARMGDAGLLRYVSCSISGPIVHRSTRVHRGDNCITLLLCKVFARKEVQRCCSQGNVVSK